jgi:mannose-6-phosphate isomerase
LAELIREDPERYVGKETADAFGGLPFLFKLLAADKPLSIQAHPNQAQARQGFERENRLGIPLDAPNRNYRDRNHKPELLCALGKFKALCGFREKREIFSLLETFFAFSPFWESLKPLRNALKEPDPGSLKDFQSRLFVLPGETRRGIGAYIQKRAPAAGAYAEEWRCAAAFAELYPGDSGILSPFYLNLISLEPGDALYIPAGVLHSYIEGFGVELMANSDNVLRGGLSSKHIDREELLAVLNPNPCRPGILKAEKVSPEGTEPPVFRYAVDCAEFSLCVMGGNGGTTVYTCEGPSIVIVIQGQAALSAPGAEEVILNRGESAFIAAGKEPVSLRGTFSLYAAGTGTGGSSRR